MNVAQVISQFEQLTPEELAALTPEEAARIEYTFKDALCAEAVASFDKGPLLWLTKYTHTLNPQYAKQGLPYRAPFPKWDYLVHVFRAFLAKYPQLYIAKSRTMLTTWSAAGYAAWAAQFRGEETLIQTMSQEKAEHVIDYVCQLYENQEPWLKERHPLERRSLLTVAWKGGGEVAGIPSGADKVRSFHSTNFILDEASHVPEGEECVNAVLPSGAYVICISTAKASWFGDACSR